MLVSSIIVTFNPDIIILKRQLHSVSLFSSVILIDNFSKNIKEIESIINEIPNKINVHKLDDNYGLAYAQNKGINLAKSINSSHVIFFDQDSFLSEQSFLNLIEAEKKLLSEGLNIGAVGPVCFDPGNKEIYPITIYYGPFISRKYLNNQDICEASFIIASGSLIRMQVLHETGYMMNDLFIDYIDVEWCFRAQSLGFKLYVTGAAKLEHIIGDSRKRFLGRTISMHSAVRRYYLTRNCIKILSLKYIPFGYKIRETFLFAARILAFFYFSNERSTYSKLMVRAFSDAFRGNFGKISNFK